VLILTRRIGQRVRIGNDVELVVLDVRGREVSLGVRAPGTVAIHREEIYRKLQDANRAAALAGPRLAETARRAARALGGEVPAAAAAAADPRRRTTAATASEAPACAPSSAR
jgi:carbon storage regulator